MSADVPNADADELDAYPAPPIVERVETRGPGVGEPRYIDITVSYWPRGKHHGRNTATVTFRRGGLTAELWDVEGDGMFSQQIAAVATATDAVREHPTVEGVAGLIECLDSEQQWAGECRRAQEMQQRAADGDGDE